MKKITKIKLLQTAIEILSYNPDESIMYCLYEAIYLIDPIFYIGANIHSLFPEITEAALYVNKSLDYETDFTIHDRRMVTLIASLSYYLR